MSEEMKMDAEPSGYILRGGRIWADEIVGTKARADKRIAERDDGSYAIPLYEHPAPSAPAGEAVPVDGVEAPDSVDFGFDDRSVKVSQEAYAIFLEREQHLRDAIAALEGQLAGGDSVSVPRELLERLVNPEAWLQDLRKSQSELRALLSRNGNGGEV